MSEEPQNTMDGRARRRASPAGIRTRPARVEPEPPPTKRHGLGATRVAVVYYLCRNHQLEHPHFMEVPLASPQGLYLRDVLSQLDALRGKGMAAKYSWSCRRRYKNGFVWHDLSEGDLLLPAQGAEYVLKGSELQVNQSTLDHQQNSTSASSADAQLPEPQQESPPAAVVSAIKEKVSPPAPQQIMLSSASASTIGYDERCRMPHSGSSPKISAPSSGASSPGLKNPVSAHDAAIQTDGKARANNTKLQQRQHTSIATPERPEKTVDEPHPEHRPTGECPSSRRSGSLQSLIRAEAAGRRRSLLQEEAGRTAMTGSVGGRLKPASLLMCLMACKPRLSRLEFPLSPELKPGTVSASTVRASETENSTGSVLGGVAGKLKASSSSSSSQDGVCEEACCWKGDPVNPSRSTSRRTSDEKTPSLKGSVVPL
ncbi:unnamed protein product [Alopecurus aequalis]